jgi:uncharacterized membrane-anchored protein
MQKLANSITYRKGDTAIGNGLAKISVPDQFRFLDGKDASVVLSDLWGNPKNSGLLGALVPTGFDPLGDESWVVVITYDEDGYVKDDDAAKIDYTKMLKDMQASTRESSEQRVKEGYGAVELVGWAKPPRYDAANHKLYWAKELKFGGDKENTLNYNVRMLGRKGVLVLNAVASMHQLAQVESATPAILTMVNFQDGHRYADYNSSTDKTATYGLAALVAGGIAAKAGLFKGLWIAILAFKKVIIIGLVALASSIKKFFAWIRGRSTTSTPPPASP